MKLSVKIRQIFNIKSNFTALEWRTIQFLILAIVIASISMLWLPYKDNSKISAPIKGGKYVEGIVANKETALFENIKQLVNCSFFYFDENNHLQPDLIERYEVSEDKLTYTFYLKEKFSAEEIKNIISKQDGFWRDLSIEIKEGNIIEIILKQPFGPLLSYLTEPIFSCGPYEVKKQDSERIILSRREDFHRDKPFLETIEILLYSSQEDLIKDLNSGKIMGGGFLDGENINIANKNLKKYSMELPRYYMLFFNLDRDTAKDKKIRKKLALNEPLDEEKSFTLTTSDLPIQKKLAEKLAVDWQEKLNIKIHIEYYDAVKLHNEIIPGRNYDLLLFGLNYGPDADPYPFWHSTQTTGLGMNLSNFRNSEADKILEEARQSYSDEERLEKYQEFRRIWNDEVPAIQIMQSRYEYYISEKIKGVVIRQGNGIANRFSFIDKWYIKER